MPDRQPYSPLIPYVGAVLAVLAASAFRWILDPWLGNRALFSAYYVAIMFAAWFGGARPALVATVLGAVCAEATVITTESTFGNNPAAHAIALISYLIVGVFASIISGSQHAANRRLKEMSAEQQKQREQLQVEVEEREKAEAEVNRLVSDLEQRLLEIHVMMDLVPVGISIAHDENCQRITSNPSFTQLLGTNASLPYTMLKDGREVPTEEFPLRRAARTGDQIAHEPYELRVEGRPPVQLLISAVPYRDRDGRVRGAIAAQVDITAQQLAAQSMKNEREWFAVTLASIGDAVIATDTSGRVTFLNPVAERLTGWTAAEAVGKPLDEIFIISDEETNVRIESPMGRVLREGVVVGLTSHTVLHSRNGRTIPIEDSAAPIRDAERRTLGVIMVFHDVSMQRTMAIERERAVRGLTASEARYARLAESGMLGIITCYLDGRIVDANPVFLSTFGYTEDDLRAGKLRWPELTPPEFRSLDEQAAEQIRKTGVCRPFEKEYFRKDGTRVPIWIAAATLPNTDGRLICFVLDLNERRRAENAYLEEAKISETLHRIGASLAAELKLENLVQQITDAGTAITRAKVGAFYYNVASSAGESYTLYAVSGVPREGSSKLPIPNDTAAAAFGPPFQGEGIVRLDDVTADPRYGKNPPFNGLPSGHLPIRSYLAAPVVLRSGEVLGGLFFGHPEPGRFTERDERLITGIAAQAAVAMENSRLYESEQTARRLAERRAERMEKLQRVMETLSGSITAAHVAETALGESLAALGAMAGTLVVPEDGGKTLTIIRTVGYAREVTDPYQRFPIDAPVPLAECVRTLEPIFLSTVEERNERYPHLAATQLKTGTKGVACLPLVSGGQVVGAVGFSFAEEHPFNEEDRRFMLAVARQCAQALERAKLYEGERRARDEAETANKAKDEFLAVVSHELRTPLTPILGWTRMLRTARFDAATSRRGLEIIERNVKTQGQLIEDLLDISRIISGKFKLNVRPVELSSVVEAALETVQPAAQAKEIRIDCDLACEGCLVSADPDRLQQVIWNLIANAVKFTDPKGLVSVRISTEDATARIVVADNGIGIDPEFLPRLFNRFSQEEGGTARPHGGLGLGLSIVRHIAELHGGTVRAESEGKGKGSRFVVELPRLIQKFADRDGPGYRVARKGEAPPLLDGVRVLVVEDEPDAREFLEMALTQWGAHVSSAASATEGLAAIARLEPNILISDISMPGMDGFALIREVRASQNPRISQVPAVALTAFARAEDRMRVLSEGFHMHVPKPVEPAELAMVVSSLLKRDRSTTPASTE